MRDLFISVAALLASPSLAQGTLVIVGGGLSPDNTEIYQTFIEHARVGDIAIIPSASGEPQASVDAFTANLVRHGVDRNRIFEVELAEVDDPATAANEALWSANADTPREVAKVKKASAIWFTGGDQVRTTRLLRPNGKPTAMLKAIEQRLSAGAVVGGSSAGAAIMGSVMIACGSSDGSIAMPISSNTDDCIGEGSEKEPLVRISGLGFLPSYIVDQHFSQRSRLPRLARAVACGGGKGLGIDEDTAIVIDRRSWTARVIGTGNVTTVDAPIGNRCGRGQSPNVTTAIYRAGDTINTFMKHAAK